MNRGTPGDGSIIRLLVDEPLAAPPTHDENCRDFRRPDRVLVGGHRDCAVAASQTAGDYTKIASRYQLGWSA